VVNSLVSVLLISKSKLLRSQAWLPNSEELISVRFQAELHSGKRIKSLVPGSRESGGPVDAGLGSCSEGEEVLVAAELVDAAEDPLYDLLCEGSHWHPR
jgi:hypothetical protein